jgi:hypothetical protein
MILCIYHHEDMVQYISGILDHGPLYKVDSAMPEMDDTAASRDPRTPIKTTPPEDTSNSDRPKFVFSYIS